MTKEQLLKLSMTEWVSLDIAAFVSANTNRYLSSLLDTVAQYRIQASQDDIRHIIFTEAVPRLQRVHTGNLMCLGEDRARLLFGSLKACCERVVRTILFEHYATCGEQLPNTTESDCSDPSDTQDEPFVVYSADIDTTHAYVQTASDNAIARQEQALSEKLELVRSYFSAADFLVLRLRIFDNMNESEIGSIVGRDRAYVRAVLSRSRSTLETIAEMTKDAANEHR